MNGKKNSTLFLAGPLAALLALGVSTAHASGISLDIHVGDQRPTVVVPVQPQPVYVAPPPQPVYVVPPQPVYVAPPPQVIEVEDDIEFVYPSSLGFYVAVGVPYDLYFMNGNYYLHRDGRWLRSSGSRGPWVITRYRELPINMRRYKVQKIREYRDYEGDIFRRDPDHYRGRHFRSEKEQWKQIRHEQKEGRKEFKREEKERRKEEKEFRKEQRREDREGYREERRGREHGERGRRDD